MSFFLCAMIGLILFLAIPLQVKIRFVFQPWKNTFILNIKFYGIDLPYIKVILNNKEFMFYYGKRQFHPKINKIKKQSDTVRKKIKLKEELLRDLGGVLTMSYSVDGEVDKISLALALLDIALLDLRLPFTVRAYPSSDTYKTLQGEFKILTSPIRIIKNLKVKRDDKRVNDGKNLGNSESNG